MLVYLLKNCKKSLILSFKKIKLNNKKNMKTSYTKKYSPEGVVYSQTVRITNNNESFIELVNQKINLDLTTIEMIKDKSYNDLKMLMYLKPIKAGINYLTCTTRDYIFNNILSVNIKDRNTILVC